MRFRKCLKCAVFTSIGTEKHFLICSFEASRQMGVIAQEVESVVPEIVGTDSDWYKSVEYCKICGLLIEAIKDLQNQLTNQAVSYENELARIQAKKQ